MTNAIAMKPDTKPQSLRAFGALSNLPEGAGSMALQLSKSYGPADGLRGFRPFQNCRKSNVNPKPRVPGCRA